MFEHSQQNQRLSVCNGVGGQLYLDPFTIENLHQQNFFHVGSSDLKASSGVLIKVFTDGLGFFPFNVNVKYKVNKTPLNFRNEVVHSGQLTQIPFSALKNPYDTGFSFAFYDDANTSLYKCNPRVVSVDARTFYENFRGANLMFQDNIVLQCDKWLSREFIHIIQHKQFCKLYLKRG